MLIIVVFFICADFMSNKGYYYCQMMNVKYDS